MANFYISDTHFGHRNIIGYDQRPYFSVDEMDADLIARWNAVVKKNDVVYHLGDVSWLKPEQEAEIVKQLNGRKILVRGNHDYAEPVWFDEVYKGIHTVDDKGRRVVLSHFPIAAYKNMERGWFHLYGHVHTSFDDELFDDYRRKWELHKRKKMLSCNVGCMKAYMDYTPKTLDELVAIRGWA